MRTDGGARYAIGRTLRGESAQPRTKRSPESSLSISTIHGAKKDTDCWAKYKWHSLCILFTVVAIVVSCFFAFTKGKRDDVYDVSDVYRQIKENSAIISVGPVDLCYWNQVREPEGHQVYLLNEKEIQYSELLPEDHFLIEAENCETGEPAVIIASETKVSGSYASSGKEYLLEETSETGLSKVEASGSDIPFDYILEEGEKAELWERKWREMNEADMEALGINRGGRRTLLQPGQRPVYLHIDIDGPMREFFGGSHEAARYAVELIQLINQEVYYPLGFDLQVTSINVRSSALSPEGKASAYLYQLDREQVPSHAHVSHHLTTRRLGGGIAYMGGLYTSTYAYGVSGNLKGGFSSWDRTVVAHELGHNFGTDHTHQFDPPIDTCGEECSPGMQGTIMSYCHTCTGGMTNIIYQLHHRVKEKILQKYDMYRGYLDRVANCRPMNIRPSDAVEFYLQSPNGCVSVDVTTCTACGQHYPQTCEQVQVWSLREVDLQKFQLVSAHDENFCWSASGCDAIHLEKCNSFSAHQSFEYSGNSLRSVGCGSQLMQQNGFLHLSGSSININQWCSSVNSGSHGGGGVTSTTTTNNPIVSHITCGLTVSGSTTNSANIIGNQANDGVHIFVAPDEAILFDSCQSDFDTYLRVYTEDLSQQMAACDDCGSCGTKSQLTVAQGVLTPGQTYKLIVEGYGVRKGNYVIDMQCGPVTPQTTSTTTTTTTTTSTTTSTPSCIDCPQGGCNQRRQENVCCSGGGCNQDYTTRATCQGGRCSQRNSHYPDCTGFGSCDQTNADHPLCQGSCNQQWSKYAACLSGGCNQFESIDPHCGGSGGCDQIGTVNAFCSAGCRGAETGECVDVVFQFSNSMEVDQHRWSVLRTSCGWNAFELGPMFGVTVRTTCCLPPAQYSLECYNGRFEGWRNSVLLVDGVRKCPEFYSGHAQYDDFLVGSGSTCLNTIIQLQTVDWGREISWSFMDTSCSGGDYRSYETYSQTCCLDPGFYTLHCQDSYGDGWQNAVMSVNGQVVCDNFQNGHSMDESIRIGSVASNPSEDCLTIPVEVITKGFAFEMSWRILGEQCSGGNYESYSTVQESCCLVDGKMYSIQCTDTFGDGWQPGSEIRILSETYCSDFQDGSEVSEDFTLTLA